MRISQGVRTPIMASVVIVELRDGNQVVERSIMVSADLVHLPMELICLVREMVAKELAEVDVNKMFISVTHTHAAPVVMPDNFVIPPGVMSVEDYGKFFAKQVAAAIVEASAAMQPGSVVIDVSVDQGGCIETTRASTYDAPTYVEEGVQHFCVTNMPGAACPKFIKAPEEHMGANVPVVTTSTWRAASSAPSFRTISIISSAVTTTTSPDLIFWLISA